jgi:hypothetical protein
MKILNEAEQAAMDKVTVAMDAVFEIEGDRLRANHGEIVAAVHVLQSAITQHALARIDPEHWSGWYE